MKKVLIVLFISVFATACNTTESGKETSEEDRFTKNSHALYVTTDKETRCKYLVFDWSNKGGITPLLKSDGTPDCE